MSLSISIRNFRGTRHAELACAPLALLCGPNEQGKSSTIDAIRCVLEGEKQPYGLTKDDLGPLLIHTGAEEASATITISKDQYMQVRWPSGDVASQGAPVRATKFATGSLVYTALEARERDKALATYLKTEPTQDEFVAAVTAAELKLSTDDVGAIWTDIKQLGWDGAFVKHKTEGTKLKGAWEATTKGASYGSKVGGTWRPKGWTPEHEAMTDADLEQEMAEASTALEAGIGKVAINADEKAKLEGYVRQIPKLEEMVRTRKDDLDRAESTKNAAQKAVQAIPVVPKEKWPECPHCQQPIQVAAGDVLKKAPAPMDPEKRKALIEQANKATDTLDKAMAEYNDVLQKYQTGVKDLQAAKDSKARLEGADADAESVNIDELRGEVKRVQSIIQAKDIIRKALQQHIAIVNKIAVVNLLDPKGLRKTKLADKIGDFNATLRTLCDTAGWAPVTLDAQGDVFMGDYLYEMAAESGRMRADIILQLAFAKLDGSEIVLLDRADTLDGKGRNGLFALLQESGLYGVIGMMLVKAKEAPDLAAAEIGQTFWIEKGEAIDLDKFKARSAA